MSEIRSVAPTLCPSMLHVCILGVCACVQVSHRHTCADDQKQKDINTLAHSVFILEAQLCRPSPLSYQWMSLRLHHLLSPHLWHVAPRRRPILNTAVYVCVCFPCCRQFLIGATLDQLLCGVLVRRLIFDADCGFDKLAAGDGVRMCLHNTQRKKTAAFVSIINPSPLKKIMLSTPDPGVFALMLLVLICQSLPWITFKYWTLSVKSSVKRMTSCVRKYLFFNSK